MLIGVIATLVTWAFAFAGGITIAGGAATGTATGTAVSIVVFFMLMVVLIFLGVRFWFGSMVCVDPRGPQPGAIESLLTSWRITSGSTLSLVVTGIVIGLLVLLSLLALVLPAIFYGAPIAVCIVGVLYALLAHHAGLVPMSPYDACPRCGYSLEGISATTCPECGADVPACAPRKRGGTALQSRV